jgi:RNA polymerase sigma factor (sigma-70 family)
MAAAPERTSDPDTPGGPPEPEHSADDALRRDLLARMATGDRSALAAFYTLEHRPVLAYLRAITGDLGLAEELLQDTFLAAWRGASAFAGRATVRSWLFAIARRRAADRLRRPALRLLPLDDARDAPTADPDPADLAVAAATQAEIAAAIARLGPLHREILILTFGHGLSYPELAETLGIPLGTVKSRLNHAKRALRPLLDPGPANPAGPEGTSTR